MTILYLIPLLVVIALLVFRKASLLQAGIIGLLITLPVAWLALNVPSDFSLFLALESAKGAWLAWLAISVILASLFFYHTIKVADSELFEQNFESTPTSQHLRFPIARFFLSVSCWVRFLSQRRGLE